MELRLKGKVALVTAASKGIGFGVARVLADEKCRVIICSRDKSAIEKASGMIIEETKNEQVIPIAADISSEQDVDRLISEANSAFGPISILVYNTGPPKTGKFLDLSSEDWNQGVKLLFLSTVWLTRKVLPEMTKNRWGRLVYITSFTLKQPLSNIVLSNSVRLAVAGLSKSIATDYGKEGITSNVILPGSILTDRTMQVAADLAKRNGIDLEKAKKERVKDIPIGRYGTIEEIGQAVAFLASGKASYINGAILSVDGGLIKSVF